MSDAAKESPGGRVFSPIVAFAMVGVGALSLLFWIAVIFFARWIGFTKGYDFGVPENSDVQFEF